MNYWCVLFFRTAVLNYRNKYSPQANESKKEVKIMIDGKKAHLLIVGFLILTVLSTMVTASAKTDILSSSALESWQPPENFVDPVTLKIREFKSQGLDDDQITAKLAELGMGWYPKTGATWMGRWLTAEELAKMPIRSPAKPPSSDYTVTQTGRISCMRADEEWTGVASEVVSGSMSVSSGKTIYHYITVQLGDLDWQTNWVETVLTHNLGESYQWYTFDNDEGEWSYYMDKDTSIITADTYVIMLDGGYDENGWTYDVWINYDWVRSGHLSGLWVKAGFQKEVFSDSGQFTNDILKAVFYRNWLHDYQGWHYWTNSISTWFSDDYPVRESHSMGATSYKWETWVQN